MAELFSMSEVGMFPSYKEPFGMVFIECMACGTPTIGANSGGPTEFVKPEQGVLIEEEPDWHSEEGMQRPNCFHTNLTNFQYFPLLSRSIHHFVNIFKHVLFIDVHFSKTFSH